MYNTHKAISKIAHTDLSFQPAFRLFTISEKGACMYKIMPLLFHKKFLHYRADEEDYQDYKISSFQ